jgi:hypothetical protein
VTEYLCLTILSRAGEAERDFKSRLTAFWTHLLRTQPDLYERVYAEATRFGTSGDRITRQYLVEAEVADAVVAALAAFGLEFSPVDRDDTYTKYEATSPDWFQIEH